MRLGDIIQVTSAETYIVKLDDENAGFLGQFVSISTSDAVIIGIVAGVSHSVREDMLGYLSQDKKAPFGCKSTVARAKHWMAPIG